MTIALLTAIAQVGYFMISLIGFLVILLIVVLGHAKLDPTSEKLAYTMLGVLGTIVTQQASFFYSRHRPQTDNDGDSSPSPILPVVPAVPAVPANAPAATEKTS